VPSENEIIEKYQVSNTTARKALHELETEGWVVRVKGKGTFVKDQTVVRAIDRIFGFTKNMIEAGRKPATKLTGFHLRNWDHQQTVNGREFTLKGPYCEIERIRYVIFELGRPVAALLGRDLIQRVIPQFWPGRLDFADAQHPVALAAFLHGGILLDTLLEQFHRIGERKLRLFGLHPVDVFVLQKGRQLDLGFRPNGRLYTEAHK
jgi:DNA-binding transcriptional MocR family regulator